MSDEQRGGVQATMIATTVQALIKSTTEMSEPLTKTVTTLNSATVIITSIYGADTQRLMQAQECINALNTAVGMINVLIRGLKQDEQQLRVAGK